MNKKVKTYLLFAIVVCIWGLIGYNIYSYSNPTLEATKPSAIKTNFKIKKSTNPKVLEIANYRDPFLGKIVYTKKKTTNKQPVPKIPFPSVIYHGLVTGNKAKSYIISVNNQQEIFKIGSTFNQIRLISANAKKVVVEFQGVTKHIQKQQ
ncbi:MAG: hypothetical protein HWD85_00015 [Flavobacteriaceae bacterium]|nr:hypothetical protein [Flavobacteriaceae bacterium]